MRSASSRGNGPRETSLALHPRNYGTLTLRERPLFTSVQTLENAPGVQENAKKPDGRIGF